MKLKIITEQDIINNQSKVFQNDDGLILHIKQTELFQLFLLKLYSGSFEFFKEPSRKVQIEAIKLHGRNIRFIDNPDDELKLLAVKSGDCFDIIQNPTREMQKIALSDSGNYIRNIKNQDEELQMIALMENIRTMRFIRNPTKAVQQAYVGLCFKSGEDIESILIPDLDLELIQNQIDCVNLIK